jgi:hypothetical protein
MKSEQRAPAAKTRLVRRGLLLAGAISVFGLVAFVVVRKPDVTKDKTIAESPHVVDSIPNAPDVRVEFAELPDLPEPDISETPISDGLTPTGDRTLQGRVNRHIALLANESIEESFANLHDMELFNYPGSTIESIEALTKPALPFQGNYLTHVLLSNRRVLKIMQELSAMNKDDAARLLSGEIDAALVEYNKIFAEWLDRHQKRATTENGYSGIGFRLSNNDDGTPTIRGIRYKLLALVFVAGHLELADARESVLAVCDFALDQRTRLYATEPDTLPEGLHILASASLYNRQILGTALARMNSDVESIEELVTRMEKAQKSVDTTAWNALVTPYDLGHKRTDYSKGRFTVKWFGEVGDDDFDALLEAARQ